MAAKNAGHGSQVWAKFDDATYVQVANVKKITPAPWESEEVDITCLDDTAENTQGAQPPNYGELSFDYFWDPSDTNHDLLDTAHTARASHLWKVLFPLAAGDYEREMNGWVKSLTPADLTSKDPIMRTCVVRITSIPTEV